MNKNPTQRKLKAILIGDVNDYTKLMMDDDEDTVTTITAYRKLIGVLIVKHHGHVVDSPGDNIMAEFDSALNAVNSAIEIQTTLKSKNQQLPIARRMSFRIGINLGDIIQKGNRIYGDGVNIAARIQSIAEPGGICVTRGIYDQVKRRIERHLEDIGPYLIKNVPDPVMIYRICLASEARMEKGTWIYWSQWKKKLMIIFVCLLFPAIAFLWALQTVSRQEKAPPIEDSIMSLTRKGSIAVLPFVDLGGDSSQNYLCRGIPEQVITSMLDDPLVDVVVAGNLLRVHGCGTGSMHPVVEKQSLRYILEGSVQCLNNQVRIIIRMVDLTTSHYVWAKTFDRELTDMFTLQDEIATNIITMLHEKRRLSIGSPDGWHLETNDTDLLFSEDGIVIE